MKYIVVTGGVVSGLGKGITISSIGRLLKLSGVRVTAIKIDPYLNVDAGTMSPFEHGETFVLDDGGETDLDLGNYERFLDVTLTKQHNITSGKIYQEVLLRERRGDYLGKTVQIVPHSTDLIQDWLRDVAKCPVDGTGYEPDVCLIEVGGTVGDIESMVFLEALRQFQYRVEKENLLFIHVSLVPVLGSVGEQKTKPTQHSVKELRSLGLSPDIVVCRSSALLSDSTKHKISVFCDVKPTNIIGVCDVSNIYHVPLILAQQDIHSIIKKHFGFSDLQMSPQPDISSWSQMAHNIDSATETVSIAIVGKYNGLSDSYLSIMKGLTHSCISLRLKLDLRWIEASDLEDTFSLKHPEKHLAAWDVLRSAQGILIPGGFGSRGVEGKILAAKFARESKKPCLGVCLGLQVMVIEYARNVLGYAEANSTEFDERTSHPLVIFMPEINHLVMGGTMRLGARATAIQSRISTDTDKVCLSLAAEIYGITNLDGDMVVERHRHRYEVNPKYVPDLEQKGLIFSGRDDKGIRMEIVELPRSVHPFYLGTQFHPEFKSRPTRASPPFFGLVAAASGRMAELGTAGIRWQEHENNLLSNLSPLSPSRYALQRSGSFNSKASQRRPSDTGSLSSAGGGEEPSGGGGGGAAGPSAKRFRGTSEGSLF